VHVPGIDFIGPLPHEVQHVTVFSSGIQNGAINPDAAKALVQFLTAPAAHSAIKAAGLDLP
jgi:molybdate transport system substrate-binding protein